MDQSRDSLDPNRTVYEEITGDNEFISVGNREVNGRAYVASFNFRGADQQKKVGELSGGERNRVHLAKDLKTVSNVLLTHFAHSLNAPREKTQKTADEKAKHRQGNDNLKKSESLPGLRDDGKVRFGSHIKDF